MTNRRRLETCFELLEKGGNGEVTSSPKNIIKDDLLQVMDQNLLSFK